MKKVLTTLLVLCLVTAQITATGALSILYGTLDTLDTALTTVENIIPGGLFHTEPDNTDPSDGYGLGITDINADQEERYVWDLVSAYFSVYSIAGLDEIEVVSVKPYLVTIQSIGDPGNYDKFNECIQVRLRARIYGFLPYQATFCFPCETGSSTDYFFVTSSGNSYQVIDKSKGNFAVALQLSGLMRNDWLCLEPDPDKRMTVKEAWIQYIYD